MTFKLAPETVIGGYTWKALLMKERQIPKAEPNIQVDVLCAAENDHAIEQHLKALQLQVLDDRGAILPIGNTGGFGRLMESQVAIYSVSPENITKIASIAITFCGQRSIMKFGDWISQPD